MNRVIFHVDVNSAFLSWEAVYRLRHLGGKLDLRTVPSAVGGSQEHRHGIILAKSVPAKQYGIQTGEPVVDAKRKCPDLLLVPPNYSLYNRSSKALIGILKRYTDRIEQYSIDEAFMDMTGCTDEPERTAYEIKDVIKRELGFTVNVGVSCNKLLAKMGSELKKPDRVHTLWPEEMAEKFWPLPVEKLFFVGHATSRKLRGLGIHTIGELAKTDPHVLQVHMKSHGLVIYQFANGLDESEVTEESPPNKGYGNSLTTPADVTDEKTAKLYLLSLSETVSARMREDGARASVVSVSLRDWQLMSRGHQFTLSAPTDLTKELYEAACRCFDQLWKGDPIRQLCVHAGQVTYSGDRQLGIFDGIDYEKYKKAEQAVDALRKRFGQDCVKRASFLESASEPDRPWIDHMGGGISRERRSVDYDRENIM